MKIILALILLTLSGVAVAGNYSGVVSDNKTCSNGGQYAAAVYDLKDDKPREFFMNFAKTDAYTSEIVRDIDVFAINYVFDKATDKKDAYMAAWAYCMDRLR